MVRITTDNCKLVDYTSRDSIHGTPPIPVYKIIVTYHHTTDASRDKHELIELVSNGTYKYLDAESIRDELVDNG